MAVVDRPNEMSTRNILLAEVDGSGTKHSPHSRRQLARNAWISIVVLICAVLLNFPLIQAVFESFRTTGEIASGPFSLAGGLTLAHYAEAWQGAGSSLPHNMLNSAGIALGSVVLVLVISSTGAYVLTRLGLGGQWLLRAVVSLRLLPMIFFTFPFYILFGQLGLLDTVVGLIFANTFTNLPIGILLLATGIQSVPLEVEEAAMLDGCGPLKRLWSIVIPLMKPAIVSTALLTFMFSWCEYLFGLTLSVVNATPLTVGATNFVSGHGTQWGALSATVVLSVLPALVMATILQRYLVSGLSLGAVKG